MFYKLFFTLLTTIVFLSCQKQDKNGFFIQKPLPLKYDLRDFTVLFPSKHQLDFNIPVIIKRNIEKDFFEYFLSLIEKKDLSNPVKEMYKVYIQYLKHLSLQEVKKRKNELISLDIDYLDNYFYSDKNEELLVFWNGSYLETTVEDFKKISHPPTKDFELEKWKHTPIIKDKFKDTPFILYSHITYQAMHTNPYTDGSYAPYKTLIIQNITEPKIFMVIVFDLLTSNTEITEKIITTKHTDTNHYYLTFYLGQDVTPKNNKELLGIFEEIPYFKKNHLSIE